MDTSVQNSTVTAFIQTEAVDCIFTPKSVRYRYVVTIFFVRSDVLQVWQNSKCNETFGTTLVNAYKFNNLIQPLIIQVLQK